MTPLQVGLLQVGLGLFGLAALAMAYSSSLPVRRLSPLVGLLGQPLWFVFCLTTVPRPWGIFVLSAAYLCVYAWGIWRAWGRRR